MLRRAPVIVAAVRLLDEAIPGRGLDPVRSRALANAAEHALQIIAAQAGAAFAQVIVLKDDLDFRAALVGLLTHRPDVLLDVIPVAAERFANVDHHAEKSVRWGR